MTVQAFAAEGEFPGIESLMTPEELEASGISGLSPQQIEALNHWLAGFTSDEPTVSNSSVVQVPNDGFGQRKARITISSRIVGDFNGWTGKTRFHLENGQVWEQRNGRRWKINLESPDIIITENLIGAYNMEVVSEGRSIGVRRIR
jgi:hypothetical protein|tara:strand:+ start:6222 stop:6659 length:438 start_codon:yes stop_codon:yes gene_type:complete